MTTAADMLARSRAAQHVEEILEVLHALDAKMEAQTFRRQQAERITDAVLAIHRLALDEMKPKPRVITGLRRSDGVIGSIGL